MSNSRTLGLNEVNPENAVDTEVLDDEMAQHYKEIIIKLIEENSKMVTNMVTNHTNLVSVLNRRLGEKDEEIKILTNLLFNKSNMTWNGGPTVAAVPQIQPQQTVIYPGVNSTQQGHPNTGASNRSSFDNAAAGENLQMPGPYHNRHSM